MQQNANVMRGNRRSEHSPSALRAALGRCAIAGCLALFGWGGVPAPAWAHDCVVKEWSIAAGVIARQPYGKGSTFRAAQHDEVVAFANLDCTKVAGPAVFRFFRDNRMALEVETSLRAGDNWRTWAAVRAQPGRYLVMLEIERSILMEDTFDITD